MDWNRSDGELPEIGEPVLVHGPKARKPVQEACRLIEYEGASRWYWSTPHGPAGRGYTILPEGVTHWRTMPEPPKE